MLASSDYSPQNNHRGQWHWTVRADIEGEARLGKEATGGQSPRRYRDRLYQALPWLGWTCSKIWRLAGEHIPNANQILAVATVILVVIGYWALTDTEETLELSERAWVGPIDAKLSEAPQKGKDVKATVTIRNTGKEPALDFTWDLKALVATESELSDASNAINQYVQSCFSMPSSHHRQVIYPSTGLGSGFEFSDTIDKSIIDEDVVNGVFAIVVRGCLAYRTFNKTHHSAFCYFYKANATPDPAHLNLCSGGSDAD